MIPNKNQNLFTEGCIWPLEEEQEEGTEDSCPMLLSTSLPEDSCFSLDAQESDQLCWSMRKPEETKSLELYSIPEDWVLDNTSANCEPSWKDSRPERSAKISLENTRFTRPSYHEDWPAVERSRLEAVGYPRACLQVLLRALLSGGVATALACRVDG